MKRITLLFALLVALSASQILSAAVRTESSINDGWTIKSITQTKKGIRGESVTLPHTWNANYIEGTTTYNREMMVYQRRLDKTADMEGKRVFLYFEGINSVADIFINRRSVGSHEGGYTACCFEITDFLKNGENQIEIWVSNAYRTDVLPISGDFNVYGGLHRPAHLLITGQDCISPLFYASPGVFVHQDNISDKQAEFRIETVLSLPCKSMEGLSLKVTVSDSQGKVVAENESTLSKLVSGKKKAKKNEVVNYDELHAFQSMSIRKPHLWNGKKDPYLYQVSAQLLRNGQILDQVDQKTGFRYFKVDPENGFFLNGDYLNLVGCCRHEDVEGKGSALVMSDYLKDFEIINDLGATAMRLAHYPHGEPMYQLSDENGIILMTEIPLCGPGGYGYTGYLDKVKDNARQVLNEFVYQKYNHPSICFWGLFNEILVNDGSFYEYDDPIPFLHELDSLYHAADPSRLTCYATCVNQEHYLDCADLCAWNKYFGWYYDTVSDFGPFLDDFHKRFPNQKLAISEYGGGGTFSQHVSKYGPEDEVDVRSVSRGRNHPQEKQTYIHINSWKTIAERDYLWGSFLWNMFDFGSALRREGDTNNQNDKGLVSQDRKQRKDAFYFYKANWNKSEQTTHLCSKTFTDRSEDVTDIIVFTTDPSVSLKINGKTIATVKADAYRTATFKDVKLSKGENRVEVKTAKGLDSAVWNVR